MKVKESGGVSAAKTIYVERGGGGGFGVDSHPQKKRIRYSFSFSDIKEQQNEKDQRVKRELKKARKEPFLIEPWQEYINDFI